ncbi:uncharacterized protein LOC129947447 [Eupeodes corollae]|uniref:uncharacterized protein LOC129947447 n=1 Tax=Eupeodes corollae TaxID=290404 RepID=UPI0024904ACB|nr:uncharacterized protein LOC129947447 [Eupeodes corollae]
MKFNMKFCILLLCLMAFMENHAFTQSPKKLLDEVAIPLANTLLPVLAIPPPAGPLMFAGIGLLQICSNIIGNLKPPEETKVPVVEKPLTKIDLMQARMALLDQVKTVDVHLLQQSEKIIRELTMAIESNGIFERMRLTLDYFQRLFVHRMSAIINPKITGIQKRYTIQDMLSFGSEYRTKLSSFINEFIKPNVNGLLILKPTKLFFEHILEKEHYLAEENDDCSSDPLHSKIYKSFVYILKTFTEAYLMAISAHVVQYQEDFNQGRFSEAEEIRENAVLLLEEFKRDSKILIGTTKLALENASREIRNCGQISLLEGKTFEHISFSHMVPKIAYYEYIDVFLYKCKKEQFINLTNYDISMCSPYTEDIPFGSELTIQLNMHNGNKHPFSYMNVKKPDNTEQMFGHYIRKMTVSNSFKTHPDCYTTFCHATKKNSYAISTQRVSALPGNVITGLRFRVKNKVIYIDIQQGTYIDILTVDPQTVFWTETPESDQIIYLGANVRKLELGNFELKNNSLLTSLKLHNSILRKGLIKVSIDGLTPPHMNNTESVNYENNELELNELHLIEADNPEEIGNFSIKNIISKPPVPNQRYYVTFQPSDFKKDFGQTTIPLLDIREVVSNPPAPLNGFGFYHQSVNGSGGFIGIKLITPKLTDRVDLF